MSLQAMLAPIVADIYDRLSDPDESLETKEDGDTKSAEPTSVGSSSKPELTQNTPVFDQKTDKVVPQQRREFPEEIKQHIQFLFRSLSTYNNIMHQVAEYGVGLSDVMSLTDWILPRIANWLKHPLKPVYSFLWVARMPFVPEVAGHSNDYFMYVVLSLDMQGRQDMVGLYFSKRSEDLWPKLTQDLQARGVKDILITCSNEPAGHEEALRKAYPQTHILSSLMLQLRYSLYAVRSWDKKAVAADLSELYSVTKVKQANQLWHSFKAEWEDRYPALVESWERDWSRLMAPLSYPAVIWERVNRFAALQSLQRNMMEFFEHDAPYPKLTEVCKAVYLSYRRVASKEVSSYGRQISGKKPAGYYTYGPGFSTQVDNWAALSEELIRLFGDRAKVPDDTVIKPVHEFKITT
ncbi:putative transposase for insertion sequence element ISRM3-like [Fibrisoma limi BUZ 3]|uniref:Mutator family transposase n=2 Tax=Fibrisoma limi TaxID=663275 RepID=I2GCG1_9BACT|nr:putative transposase for insertion sequence element ISRM3-like [Fibrisoma limi BUZ 3]